MALTRGSQERTGRRRDRHRHVDQNNLARWIANELERSAPDRFAIGTDQSANVDEYNEPRPDVVVARVQNLLRSPFPIKDAALVVEVVSRVRASVIG